MPSGLRLKSANPGDKYTALFENSSLKEGNQTSSKAYGYLTGRTMSRSEEIEALNELKSMSPTGSFIEAISSGATNSTDCDIRKNIDSLRVKVVALSLSKAGERETASRSLTGQTRDVQTVFVVECKLSPFLQKVHDLNDPIRFTADQDLSSLSSKFTILCTEVISLTISPFQKFNSTKMPFVRFEFRPFVHVAITIRTPEQSSSLFGLGNVAQNFPIYWALQLFS